MVHGVNMLEKYKRYLVVAALLFAFYFVVPEVLARVAAVFNETPNATVVLSGCESVTCRLQGTLKTDPITLTQFLVKEDGTRVYFNKENVSMISWPVNDPHPDKLF
eukprot:UN19168